MTDGRLARILARLSSEGGADGAAARLCAVSAEVTGMNGAGISLMSGDLPKGSMCASNDVSELIEELQFTFGEGPCVDAYQQHRPIGEPDLAAPQVPRWMAFTPPAIEAGVRAVFGFPLLVGAVRLGALNLYRDRAGPLTSEQHADALTMAAVAARAVIEMQAHAPPGTLGAELEVGTNFRFIVHQATGMVAVQLGVSVTEALIRLRAHAFARGQLVSDVADEVVSGRLRFDDGGEQPV